MFYVPYLWTMEIIFIKPYFPMVWMIFVASYLLVQIRCQVEKFEILHIQSHKEMNAMENKVIIFKIQYLHDDAVGKDTC